MNKLTDKNILLPKYDGEGLLNTISSILKHYGIDNGKKTNSKLDKILSKNYKNVVLIIFDGMGEVILNNISKNGYFEKNKLMDVTSVYPSTTTAALTTYYCGKCPYESGYIAWTQYFKEYGRTLDMLPHLDSYTGERIKSDYDVFKEVVGYKSVFNMIEETGVKAYSVTPLYDNRKSIREVLASNLDELIDGVKLLCNDADRKYIMAYCENPDHLLHKYGTDSDEVKSFILEAENKLSKMIGELEDTVVIISADHGHKNIDKVYEMNDYPEIQECLIMPEMLESRCVGFFVKEEMKKEFEERFNNIFSDDFILLTKEDVLESKLLGIGEKHKKIDDFIGNYLAVSKGSAIIRLQNHFFEGKKVKKSTHCGLTKDEMLIPLIVIEK